MRRRCDVLGVEKVTTRVVLHRIPVTLRARPEEWRATRHRFDRGVAEGLERGRCGARVAGVES